MKKKKVARKIMEFCLTFMSQFEEIYILSIYAA